MSDKQKEINACKAIESLLDSELGEYGFTFKITDCEISSEDNAHIDVDIIQNQECITYMNFKVENIFDCPINDEDELTNMKTFVEIGEDCYEEIATYDWTIKYLYIAFMKFP